MSETSSAVGTGDASSPKAADERAEGLWMPRWWQLVGGYLALVSGCLVAATIGGAGGVVTIGLLLAAAVALLGRWASWP